MAPPGQSHGADTHHEHEGDALSLKVGVTYLTWAYQADGSTDGQRVKDVGAEEVAHDQVGLSTASTGHRGHQLGKRSPKGY